MDKVIIEVRINEYASRRENANVPFSPTEICEEAMRCWSEGASIIHYHARDPQNGAPSTNLEHYAETARLIKEQSDLLIMPTLGAWTLPSPEARISHITAMARDAATRPDFAPIDMGSSNVDVYDSRRRQFRTEDVVYHNPTKTLRYFAETIQAAGVRPYVALWNVSGIRVTQAFVECGLLAPPLYAGIVMSEGGLYAGNPATIRGLQAMVDFIPADARIHWSAMCVGGNLFPLVGATLERGGHIAVGLGDYPYNEIGTPRNAELVERIAEMARQIGREVASPTEVRKLLGLG